MLKSTEKPPLPAILQAVAETYDLEPSALVGAGHRFPARIQPARRAYAILARRLTGATQAEIAGPLRCHRANISDYLSGPMDTDMADRLAHAEAIVRAGA